MKEIPLTQGKVARVDDVDFEAVSQFKWCAHKRRGGIFYAARNAVNSDGTKVTQYLHQFLVPNVRMVDHEDGDGLNNCRYNLRPCNHSQNGHNRKSEKGTSSKFKGVSWDSRLKKWMVQIMSKSQHYYIGLFTSEEDAARAYDKAAKRYHGDFARLNFP